MAVSVVKHIYDCFGKQNIPALLATLGRLGRRDQVTTLLSRDPLNRVTVTSPTAGTAIWEMTSELASPAQLTALATRACQDTEVTDLLAQVPPIEHVENPVLAGTQ